MTTSTKPAARFGFTLSLRVDDDHVYEVPSPSVEVGAYAVEMGEALETVTRILAADAERPEEERLGDAAVPEKVTERVKQIAERAPEVLTSKGQFRAYLGDDVYEQMVADGMPFEVVKLAVATVSVWVQSSREAAIAYWDNGGRPRPPRKAPTDRRTKRS